MLKHKKIRLVSQPYIYSLSGNKQGFARPTVYTCMIDKPGGTRFVISRVKTLPYCVDGGRFLLCPVYFPRF